MESMKICFLLSTAICLPVYAADLPKSSQMLLSQFDDYETKKIKEFNQDMLRVKKQVVTTLKKHLQTATKNSDLDASQALIAKIKDFEQQVAKLEEMVKSNEKPEKPTRTLGEKKHTYVFNGKGERWRNAKVRVEKGQTVSISVEGEIGLSTFFKDVKSNGNGVGIKQHGHNNDYTLGVLLARISTEDDQWYEIGKKGSFKAEKTGSLELSINDRTTEDNTGKWELTIVVK